MDATQRPSLNGVQRSPDARDERKIAVAFYVILAAMLGVIGSGCFLIVAAGLWILRHL